MTRASIEREWLNETFGEEDGYYLWSQLLFCEIIVRFTDNLPNATRGLITIDRDGRYNIYINSRLCQELMVEAITHELDHVLKGDLEEGKDIYEVEEYLTAN